MTRLGYILLSMRPSQWTKNLVTFAGLIFSQNFTNGPMWVKTVDAFLAFCLMSGMIYLINDIADIERDRLHEQKRHRPLPSGKLPVSTALVAAVIGSLGAIVFSWFIGFAFFIVALAFFALNLVYSFVLKKIALLDATSISISFILRAIGGVEAIRAIDPSVRLSPWLLICTLFLSLFLAFCKRRHELLNVESAGNHRESLLDYSPALLDQLVGITAGGSVLAYSIYTIWPDTVSRFGTTNLVYTIPLVLIGVMRYLHLVYHQQKGGNPSDLLIHEKFLFIVVLLWILLVVIVLTLL